MSWQTGHRPHVSYRIGIGRYLYIKYRIVSGLIRIVLSLVLTTSKPSHLHHLITVQPHRSTCFSSVVTLPFSFIIIFMNDWSVFSLCLTSSLESSPSFSPTASCRSLHLGLWSSYACQFSSFHKFTTLIINKSFTFTLGSKPTSFTNPSHHRSSLSPRLTQRTLAAHSFFSISGFVFVSWGRLMYLRAFDRMVISHMLLLLFIIIILTLTLCQIRSPHFSSGY